MSADMEAAGPGPSAPSEPVIPGCVQYKYYRTPTVSLPEGSTAAELRHARPKRKVAILFGYVGERYCGLQWNRLPEYPTVEEALLKALYETDMISLANFSTPKLQQLIGFERASRTDKGVHALRNLFSVSIMLPYSPEYIKDLEEGGTLASGREVYSCAEAKRLLNLALPPDIHVYAVVPVTRSFNAYMNCGRRQYEYYIPTFAFLDPAAYTRYFPPDFAPERASLADIGYRRPAAPAPTPGQRQPLQAQLTEEEEEAAKRRKKYEKFKRLARGGRKNRGHFPKSKQKRERDAEAFAAWEETERLKEQAGTDGGAAPPHKTHRTEGQQQQQQQEQQQEEEEEEEGEEDEEDGSDSEAEAEGEVPVQISAETDLAQTFAYAFNDNVFDKMILYRHIPEDRMRAVAGYRLPPDQLQAVRSLFAQYEGTHCYHNFTPGGHSRDPSCHRFIRSVTVSDPFLVRTTDPLVSESIEQWTPSRFFSPDAQMVEDYTRMLEEGGATEAAEAALRERMRAHAAAVYDAAGGIEVVRITLDGQSFMLNQIRKMIGAVSCVAVAGLPTSYLRDCLLSKRTHRCIPMVPANGLFLSNLDYSGYNMRLERIQTNGGNGCNKEGIDFTDPETVSPAELEAQRSRTVAVVLRNEMFEDRMGKWMRSLRHALKLGWKMDVP